MCSIFGSFDIEEAKTLQIINASRGALSHSVSVFNSNGIEYLNRGKGPVIDFGVEDGKFHLFHQQAPTTQESNTIHPSEFNSQLLWHNGIVKIDSVRELQKYLESTNDWDTFLLNKLINQEGFSGLSIVRGSFTCVLYCNNSLYLFRNQISPMFVKGSTISSVQFDGSVSIDANFVYTLDWKIKQWVPVEKFENNELPFFFLE